MEDFNAKNRNVNARNAEACNTGGREEKACSAIASGTIARNSYASSAIVRIAKYRKVTPFMHDSGNTRNMQINRGLDYETKT